MMLDRIWEVIDCCCWACKEVVFACLGLKPLPVEPKQVSGFFNARNLKRRSTQLIIMGVLLGFGLTLNPDSISAEPNYCQQYAGVDRFITKQHAEGDIVLDRETGLTWMRNPTPSQLVGRSKISAMNACYGLSYGNRGGWRLPTLAEFTTLFTATTTLPFGHPLFAWSVNRWYWTLTASDTTGKFFQVAPLGDSIQTINIAEKLQSSVFDPNGLNLERVICVKGGKQHF